jgi:hypothetical protein
MDSLYLRDRATGRLNQGVINVNNLSYASINGSVSYSDEFPIALRVDIDDMQSIFAKHELYNHMQPQAGLGPVLKHDKLYYVRSVGSPDQLTIRV